MRLSCAECPVFRGTIAWEVASPPEGVSVSQRSAEYGLDIRRFFLSPIARLFGGLLVYNWPCSNLGRIELLVSRDLGRIKCYQLREEHFVGWFLPPRSTLHREASAL